MALSEEYKAAQKAINAELRLRLDRIALGRSIEIDGKRVDPFNVFFDPPPKS